jgi:hypothetical protein
LTKDFDDLSIFPCLLWWYWRCLDSMCACRVFLCNLINRGMPTNHNFSICSSCYCEFQFVSGCLGWVPSTLGVLFIIGGK